MSARTFVLIHVLTAVVGTALFWWLVMPSFPLEAIADGLTAAAVAGYAEIMAVRFGF
jgi:hypothetical protein